jgi:signal transduction histidine kinase
MFLAVQLVAEALSNVGKDARASRARVRMARENGTAVRGRLRVESPAGGGTRVRALIPCPS